jgi:hypothetical protein
MSDFNARIIEQIEQHRLSNPKTFKSRNHVRYHDYPLLLMIVLSVGRVPALPDLEACANHIDDHTELIAALDHSYISNSFEDLIRHRMICPPISVQLESHTFE